jgi:GTP-binding protein
MFFVNESFYLVDLPGYGYAKASREVSQQIEGLVNWYLFLSGYQQKKVVLIVDSKIGPTKDDLEMLTALRQYKKDVVVIANKIDKLKKAELWSQLAKIQKLVGDYSVIPFSSVKKAGVKELLAAIS